jgi:hypothetical protein
MQQVIAGAGTQSWPGLMHSGTRAQRHLYVTLTKQGPAGATGNPRNLSRLSGAIMRRLAVLAVLVSAAGLQLPAAAAGAATAVPACDGWQVVAGPRTGVISADSGGRDIQKECVGGRSRA